MSRKISIAIVLVVLLALLGFGAWTVLLKPSDLPPEGFARGNGRIEADLIDITPRLAGRVAEIGVREGDLVQPGDVLAVMDTAELKAQLRRAEAAVASAEAAVGVAAARVAEAEARLALAQSEQARAETLAARDVISRQDLEIRRTETQLAEAGLAPPGPRSAPRNAPSMPRQPHAARSPRASTTARFTRRARGGCSTGWHSPAR
jgi:HlyD family secretion protein